MEENIEKVSNILNDEVVNRIGTGAYTKIGKALGIKINTNSEIFREIEEFIVKKFNEMKNDEGIEFKVTAEVELVEDGEIDNVVIISVNVFAKDEDEAMDKADDNIREQNSEWEDCCIHILTVNEA